MKSLGLFALSFLLSTATSAAVLQSATPVPPPAPAPLPAPAATGHYAAWAP